MYKTEIKTIRTERFEMDYFVFGEGKKQFVMIPGISVEPVSKSAAAVAAAYDMFGKDYTVYVFDRARKFGDRYSIEEMSRDTAEAMRLAGVKDAYILGASQGGMILLTIARDHPELVNRGILASTACRIGDAGRAVLERWRDLARTGEPEKMNHEMFSHLYTPEYIETYKDIFAALEKQGSREEMHKLAVLCDACMNFDMYDSLGDIRCPMLVIGAENDTVFPAETASREMAEKLGCGLYIYEHYCHAVYDEAPDYKARIMEFFEQ